MLYVTDVFVMREFFYCPDDNANDGNKDYDASRLPSVIETVLDEIMIRM